MAKNSAINVRFLGGCAPRATLLGLLAFPAALEGKEVECTRFYTVTPERWAHREINADIVSIVFEDGPNGKCWWLLGKRGDVYAVRPTGVTNEQISDAGTGPGKFGYLSSIRYVRGRLLACGFSRQIYERTENGWIHADLGVILDAAQMDLGFNDLTGNDAGDLCAVGDEGEIAIQSGERWTMMESPTNVDLYAVCSDSNGRFIAAGRSGTVLCGDRDGFNILCGNDAFDNTLWDIEDYQGEIVASCTNGLYSVRGGSLVPFDKPKAPSHVGYRLVQVDNVLWSIGTYQVFCLDKGRWSEWQCPDNKR
jgi:hypothetical protein